MQKYTYQIVARGKILESKTIILKDNPSNISNFAFTPTFEYAPKATVIVYCVNNETIISSSSTIDLKENFKNYIDLEVVPDAVKPGSEVEISIKSNPKSHIGLLAIDQSVLLLRSGNDLTRDTVWQELEMCYKPKMSETQSFRTDNKVPYFCFSRYQDFSVR